MPGATVEGVAATLAEQLVVAGAAQQVVVARAAVQLVMTAAAVEQIVSGPAEQEVVAGVALEVIVTGQAVDLVVAGAAGEMVVAVGADDHVVAAGADDVIADRPGRALVAGRGGGAAAGAIVQAEEREVDARPAGAGGRGGDPGRDLGRRQSGRLAATGTRLEGGRGLRGQCVDRHRVEGRLLLRGARAAGEHSALPRLRQQVSGAVRVRSEVADPRVSNRAHARLAPRRVVGRHPGFGQQHADERRAQRGADREAVQVRSPPAGARRQAGRAPPAREMSERRLGRTRRRGDRVVRQQRRSHD